MEKAIGGRYTCPFCPFTYSNRCNLRQHVNEEHSQQKYGFSSDQNSLYKCQYCEATFATKYNRDVHLRRVRPRRFRERGVNLHLYLHCLCGRYDFQGEWIFVVRTVNGKYIGQDSQGLHRFEVNPKGVAVQRSKTEERLNSLMGAHGSDS